MRGHRFPVKMKCLLPLSFVLVILVTLSSGKSPLKIELHRDLPLHSKEDKGLRFTKRLPTDNVLPVYYDLKLVPIFLEPIGEFPQYDCEGEVTITVIATATVRTITLNGNGIFTEVTKVTFEAVDSEDGAFTVTAVDLLPDDEFIVITVDRDLTIEHQYKLTIKFTSKISTTQQNGLFLTSFPDENDNPSYLVSTHLEPTAAREVFPCFDEPQIKATFKISVAYNPTDDGYIALGNNELEMPPQDYDEFPGWKINHFRETVPMSAYLVAIVVAKFDCVTATPSAGDSYTKPAQVCGPPNLVLEVENGGEGGGVYAADQSSKLLSYFQDLTGINYHLDKMDSVAIPNFSGAMENWGLNIYGFEPLLYYPQESGEWVRRLVTETVAHELIHQWFGNLVTCNFWDQIWLNEGFATYFTYLGVNHIQENFNALEWRQFDSFQVALNYDASESTHPLINAAQVGGTTFEYYRSVFSTISYQKGGSLLRMMEGFLTYELFIQGLKDYLTQMSFQGATQDDLYYILTQRAIEVLPPGLTVKDIMDTWSLQSGFPLVRVSKASDTIVLISQERFGSVEVIYTPGSPLDPNHLWTIPITIATADDPDFTNLTPKLWIQKEDAMRSYNVDTSKWIVVNTDAIGFYRVLYDAPLFDLLVERFNTEGLPISVMSRSQIIDDYFTFYRHGYAEIENALRLTSYLGQETRAVVWATVSQTFQEFLLKLSGTEAYNQFKIYLVGKLHTVLEAIGLEQEIDEQGGAVILRSLLLDWACVLGHEGCRDYARTSFAAFYDDPVNNVLPFDIQHVLFCGAVAGDTTSYTMALSLYNNPTTSPSHKAMLFEALPCTEDEAIIDELLEYVLEEDSDIPIYDRENILYMIAEKSFIGRTHAIAFVQENLVSIVEEFTTRAIVSFFRTLSDFIGTTPEIQALRDLVSEHETLLADVITDLEVHLATMQGIVEWRAKYEGRLETWFRNSN